MSTVTEKSRSSGKTASPGAPHARERKPPAPAPRLAGPSVAPGAQTLPEPEAWPKHLPGNPGPKPRAVLRLHGSRPRGCRLAAAHRRPRTALPGCEVWALGVSCCTVRHRVPPAQVGPTDLGLRILLPGPPCAPPGPRASALRPVCLLSPPRAPAPCAVPTGPQQRPGRPCALACSEGPGPGLLVAGRGRGAG